MRKSSGLWHAPETFCFLFNSIKKLPSMFNREYFHLATVRNKMIFCNAIFRNVCVCVPCVCVAVTLSHWGPKTGWMRKWKNMKDWDGGFFLCGVLVLSPWCIQTSLFHITVSLCAFLHVPSLFFKQISDEKKISQQRQKILLKLIPSCWFVRTVF